MAEKKLNRFEWKDALSEVLPVKFISGDYNNEILLTSAFLKLMDFKKNQSIAILIFSFTYSSTRCWVQFSSPIATSRHKKLCVAVVKFRAVSHLLQ